jgi:hypothetical protein
MVIFAAGFIIGGLIAWLLAGRQKEKEPVANPEQDAWLRLRRQYAERTSLWQDRATGRLAVRMGDHLLTSSDQLSDAQRRNLNTTMKEWLVWLGFPVSQAASESPAMEAALVTPPPQGFAPVIPGEPPAPEEIIAAAALADPANAQGKAKSAPEKPKSIVEQIDEILQDKLRTSQVHNKGVRLVEDPKEGVVVWVGLEHYAGVDAVTDPEVKALLKTAVGEWERRQTPGKR